MRRPKKGPVRLSASSQSIPNAAKARRLASRWQPSASMSGSSRSKKTALSMPRRTAQPSLTPYFSSVS